MSNPYEKLKTPADSIHVPWVMWVVASILLSGFAVDVVESDFAAEELNKVITLAGLLLLMFAKDRFSRHRPRVRKILDFALVAGIVVLIIVSLARRWIS